MAQRMTPGRRLAILLATAAALASPAATVAVAAESGRAAEQAQQAAPAATDPGYATQDALLRASQEGLEVLGKVHQARAELQEGQSDTAGTLLEEASATLDDAGKDLRQMMVADTESATDDPVFVPVDVQIGYGESFVPDDASKQALDEAGAQLRADQPGEALKTMRLAELDMQVVAAMMPLQETLGHISDARTAISGGDTAQAQASLAALEDGVVVRGWDIDAIPRQGDGSVQQSSAASALSQPAPGPARAPVTAAE
ncbi:YfdX family protein [Mangrovicoccus algicola]|uniref:YfdX family protein n=1 Tax=Mangrovicoccus algicola TaxID=2771008 RepID=A0A8J6ZAH0_9RHOB|nr:YfdX family protein [Mangrovicoccus algicola]MBE3639395.1 YfdX family protein [Mangrovicoccus algicola]